MRRPLAWTMVAMAGLCSSRALAQDVTAPDDPQGIYGGAPVDTCAWPAAIFVGGCTASLVHPRMVVLAAHCVAFGSPYEALFGENYFQPVRTVPIEGCVEHPQWGQGMPGDGQHDIAICELTQPIDDVPIVPILMGCEAEMLQPGAAAWLVGFGQADDALGDGPKREVATEIQQVGTDAIWVGDDVHAACYGDSGGPAYLQLPDGSWRVFGATSGAATQSPECPQTGVWTMIHPYVPWIEETSMIDVTPCHDADGTWNPSEACTEFPLAPGVGDGSWAQGCEGEASEASASCGPAFGAGDESGESTGASDESSSSGDAGGDESTSEGGDESTSEGDAAGTTGDELEGTGVSAAAVPMREDDQGDGCGCTSSQRPAPAIWGVLSLMVLCLTPRRKRRRLGERPRWRRRCGLDRRR